MERLRNICRDYSKYPIDVDKDLVYILKELSEGRGVEFKDPYYKGALLNFLCKNDFITNGKEPQSLRVEGQRAMDRGWVCFNHKRHRLLVYSKIAYYFLTLLFSAIAAFGVIRGCGVGR